MIAEAGQGAAIRIWNGRNNTVNNHGTLSTTAPWGASIVGDGPGNDIVQNWGTVIGSIDLGAGINEFNNHAGASLYSGWAIDVGADGLFTNEGTLSPGPQGTIYTVGLTGDFVQSGTPRWLVDVGPWTSDELTVSGHADLSQSVTTVDVFSQGLRPGRYALLTANGGLRGGQFQLGTLYGQMPLFHTLDFPYSDTIQELTVLPSGGSFHWTGAIGGTWATGFTTGVTNWSRTGGTDYILGTPGALSDVFFSGADLTAMGADFTINSLTLGGGSNYLAADGHTLTLVGSGGRGLTVTGSGVIGVDVILGGDQSWMNDGSLAVTGSSVGGFGSNLTLDGSGTTLISAAIRMGPGSLTKAGSGTLVLTGANSYSGGTTILDGTLVGDTTSLQGDIVNHAALVFDQPFEGTFAGSISGTGWLLKENVGTLTLTGVNTYTGGTWVRGGTLLGSAMSLPGSVLNEGTIIFDEAGSGQYDGVFEGTGSVIKHGSGSLVLTGNSLSFKGWTSVEAGQLFVNGLLGGSSLTMRPGTLLGGIGVVPSTTIERGAVLAPGQSVGMLQVLGDLRIHPGATYRVETEAYGFSDLTLVSGQVFADGATLDIRAIGTRKYRPINFYRMLESGGGVHGTFSNVTTTLPYLDPSVQYSGNTVDFTLRRNDVDFRTMGTQGNQTSVAQALNALVSTATGGLASVVNTIYDLEDRDALNAMSSMTGVVRPVRCVDQRVRRRDEIRGQRRRCRRQGSIPRCHRRFRCRADRHDQSWHQRRRGMA